MSISSLFSTSPLQQPTVTLSGKSTAGVIKDVLSEEHQDSPRPQAERDFKDTLARLSAQHEASEEDNPESDTAYQALLKPVAEQGLQAPAHQDFLTLAQSFTMPDRPKTSPSKLALSVELKPVTDQDDLLSQARHRARLKLLAPLDHELSDADHGGTDSALAAKKPSNPFLKKIDAELATQKQPAQPDQLLQENDDIEIIAQDSHIETESFERQHAPQASASLKTLPTPSSLQQPPPEAVIPTSHTPSTEPAPSQATTPATIAASETGGAILSDAVERTQFARRVALSMENSPRGQSLELEIKDYFGKPLTLKILFEDQRARATCFGSQFHDPDQMQHVLDSVRTALEASGFELGDFIMHHHKDRRSLMDQERAQGNSSDDGEQAEKPEPREILRIVGIVNRIA